MPAQLRVKEMKNYPIVIEKTDTGYSAYSPKLDGCVATGETRGEAERQMQEALVFHLEGMGRGAASERDQFSSGLRRT